MGQIAKALGGGSTIEFRGETYTLSPWTYAIQSAFESYLEEHALRTVRRLAKVLPKDEYDRLLRETVRDIAAGVYTFGNEAVADAMHAGPHVVHITWLMIKANHPHVPLALVQDMYREEVDRVVEAVGLANADPTTSPPRETGEAAGAENNPSVAADQTERSRPSTNSAASVGPTPA